VEFYQVVLGGNVDVAAEDWIVLTLDGLRLALKLAEDLRPADVADG
jgi:hypothetical protein